VVLERAADAGADIEALTDDDALDARVGGT